MPSLASVSAMAPAIVLLLVGPEFFVSAKGSSVSSDRLTVVVSDLHMGVGRNPQTGGWRRLEDFRWGDEFARFLEAVDHEGDGATDLVLNGDVFELWQSLERDCAYSDERLGCTEADAAARLERVLIHHAAELRDLGEFASSGTNRVVVIPGDHDAALLFPSVARQVLEAIPAPDGRVDVASDGYWLSADGLIYAEHGHQIGFEANRFAGWPIPFSRQDGRTHLERPWGERVIQEFYNRYEDRYPIVDNISQEGLGVKYAFAAEESNAAIANTGQFLRFFLFKMPWHQLRSNLESEIEPPQWDIARIRSGGDAFLVESLPPDDPFMEHAAKALAEDRLGFSVSELTDTEIVAICDYRAALRRARRRLEQGLTQLARIGPAVRECPRLSSSVGATFQYFWRSRDTVFMNHVEETIQSLERAGRSERAFEIFIYGHTHLSHPGFSPAPGSRRPTVLNTGAWQRVIYPAHLELMKQDRRLSDREALREVQPEDLLPCYSFISIEPYLERPRPVLRYWRQADDGVWSFARPARGGICPQARGQGSGARGQGPGVRGRGSGMIRR